MTFEALLYEIEDNILTITFNRPEAMNSFSGPMFGEL
ncbi:MAG: enoyl-CoA hydratase, partial [Gammaproteobacteria bacterium]|nr:enoyl-CoA hydratase [Gammaproteobacteria bacterium]MBT5724673.1 enoyl-CoA hydratase [Gammaproteobacteria bacterium]